MPPLQTHCHRLRDRLFTARVVGSEVGPLAPWLDQGVMALTEPVERRGLVLELLVDC